MENPKAVTAVFDIGKTNKKFFLFDKQYNIVEQRQVQFEETTDEDGDHCEDLNILVSWIKRNFKNALENDHVNIQALNFSTYGASLVQLNESGEVITPLYNYLKPYPRELLSNFYQTVNGKQEFSLQTASPPMGMLNSGLQLYWLKKCKPDFFNKIHTSLHFPQYLSFLFTGERSSEMTSIGCHTTMWDFQLNQYHRWIKKEDFQKLLPAPKNVSETQSVTYENKPLKVGLGIHDSSAALVPYLYSMNDPFLLVSTGTWSITFNPFNKEPLTYKELQRDCLCYIDVYGNQVKASRLLLGNEYRIQKNKMMEQFGISGNGEDVKPDLSLIEKMIKAEDSSLRLKLETAYSSGPYPQDIPGNWDVSRFSSYEQAYHQLILDLVAIQAESIRLVTGKVFPKKMIITGGFSRNEFFVRLLAGFFPEIEIYTSSLSNASALGAALVVNKENSKGSENNSSGGLLDLIRHEPISVPGINHYKWKESIMN